MRMRPSIVASVFFFAALLGGCGNPFYQRLRPPVGPEDPGETVDAQAPLISVQPTGGTVNRGESFIMAVGASVDDGGSLSWQWYAGTSANFASALAVEGANAASYAPSTGTAGTSYHWCVVTNTNQAATGSRTASATSNAATLVVLGGSGFDIDFN